MGDQKMKVVSEVVPRKHFSLAGFLGLSKAKKNQKSQTASLPLKPSGFYSVPANAQDTLAWIQDKIVEEEKILHQCRQVFDSVKTSGMDAAHLMPGKTCLGNAFSTQSVTTSPSMVPKSAPFLSSKRKIFFDMINMILILGCMAGGVFAYFYFWESDLKKDAVIQLERVQKGHMQLAHDYIGLKGLSTNQQQEIQRLSLQIRHLVGDLRTAREKVSWLEAREKPYRDELLQMTMRYEQQLALMRKLVSTREEIVQALKAQVQAVEKLIEEGAFPGMRTPAMSVSKEGQEIVASESTPSFEYKVVSIDGRYNTILINKGYEEGVRAGQRVRVVQHGEPIAEGLVDQVYPDMASLLFRNLGDQSKIREGDGVLFLNG